jgi:hypothetical protein
MRGYQVNHATNRKPGVDNMGNPWLFPRNVFPARFQGALFIGARFRA